MCISVLSAKYLTIELLGEYVFLRFDQGYIQVREVYDFFFSVSTDWVAPVLVCVSPHALVDNDVIHVTPVSAPGAGGPDDAVYEAPAGFGREYDPIRQSFSVQVHDVKNPHNPTTVKLEGRVIVPAISLPNSIQNDAVAANVVMSACGTVFHIHLPDLKANQHYAMRLVVEPIQLLGLTSPRSLEQFDLKPFTSTWRQDAEIKCPKNCWFECRALLEKTRHMKPAIAPSALAIEALIVDPALTIARVKRHRIVIVLPKGCDIYRDNAVGCIASLGPVSAGDKVFHEYYGGIERYSIDDIESLGQAVWTYLMTWAGEPKTKESITTALGAQHSNCSMVVDAMVKKGAVVLVDKQRGLYQGCPIPEEQLGVILEKIATDPRIVSMFVWIGYRICYAVEYSYLSNRDKLKFGWERLKFKVVFWLAIVGVIGSLPVLVKWFEALVRMLKALFPGPPP